MARVHTSKLYREKTIALLYGLPPDSPWNRWIETGDPVEEDGDRAVHRRIALALEAEHKSGYLRAVELIEGALPKLVLGALKSFQDDLSKRLGRSGINEAMSAQERSNESVSRMGPL